LVFKQGTALIGGSCRNRQKQDIEKHILIAPTKEKIDAKSKKIKDGKIKQRKFKANVSQTKTIKAGDKGVA